MIIVWLLDSYIYEFENSFLTFFKTPQKSPLPWWEGMKGRGDQKVLSVHPHPDPPPSKGGGELVGRFQIFLDRI